MFHGPPPTKIKRELTPSKELSPCHQDRSPMPYGEKCLYSYSACDRKPTSGFKPLTPPSTPVSPCGPTSTAGTHSLSEQAPPPLLNVANPAAVPRPVHVQEQPVTSSGPPNQRPLHSPPFAVPCALISQDANNFTPEHRFQRQMSEPSLPFPPSESQGRPQFLPHPPNSTSSSNDNLSREGRPLYHRQMSEPLVAVPPQGFKQELIDPRYTEQGVPTMAPVGPQRQPAFHPMAIKQEPRDYCFDSEGEECAQACLFWPLTHDCKI
ncbi:unnamed protein product [Lampetra planeri]